ncbi:hypothetical protein ABIF64_008018 [Bradyrhizobium japonicum]
MPPERQHDVGVLGNLLPGDVALGDVLVARKDLRQQHRGRARGIGVHRAHIAAHRDVEEAMHLALGMMEAARARPAVGATEHGAGAARVADAAELVAEQIERLLPTDGDELIAAAAIVRARSALEPAAADRRLGDARLMTQRAGEIADDAVRIGVARIGPDLESSFALTRGKHAPMRGVGLEAVREVEAGVGKANRIVHRLILIPRGTGPAATASIPVAVYQSAPRCRRDQGRRKRRAPARKYSLVTVQPRHQRRFLGQFILYFQYLIGRSSRRPVAKSLQTTSTWKCAICRPSPQQYRSHHDPARLALRRTPPRSGRA